MKNNCCSSEETSKMFQDGMTETSHEGFNPMEMCKSMMESINNTAKMAGFATSEVRALFEEWANEVENEVLAFIKHSGQVNTTDIAKELKISEDSVLYFVSKLIREKKIKVLNVQVL